MEINANFVDDFVLSFYNVNWNPKDCCKLVLVDVRVPIKCMAWEFPLFFITSPRSVYCVLKKINYRYSNVTHIHDMLSLLNNMFITSLYLNTNLYFSKTVNKRVQPMTPDWYRIYCECSYISVGFISTWTYVVMA